MSRHSKNNTANPVFTYAERKMIKDFGQQSQRVGSDSQKPFEFCYLCVSRVIDPVSCTQGHIFCYECIVNNLQKQKQDYIRLSQSYEEKQKQIDKQQIDNELESQKLKQDEFEKLDYHNDMVERKTFKDKAEQKLHGIIDHDSEIKSKLLQKGQEMLTKTKEELISKNFWVPDTQQFSEAKGISAPEKKFMCPATKKHEIKFKKLYKVYFNTGGYSEKKEVFCHACNKTLKYQKIAMAKKCGHAMCLDCIKKVCIPDGRCMVCNESCQLTDLIHLQEAHSGFSAHNEVEVKIFNPVMLI